MGVPFEARQINKKAEASFGTKTANGMTKGIGDCSSNRRISFSGSPCTVKNLSNTNAGEDFPPDFHPKETKKDVKVSDASEDKPHKRLRFAEHVLPDIKHNSKTRSTIKDEPPQDNIDVKKVSLPIKGCMRRSVPKEALVPCKNVDSSSYKMEISACASPLLERLPLVNSTGTCLQWHTRPSSTCNGVQEEALSENSPNIEKYPENGPALKVIWRGNFEIMDIESKVRLCEGLLAHPSAKISCKAYELARQIVGVLHFTMYSRNEFWTENFQTKNRPNRNDIALYFYPGNYERSKSQYSYLLRFVEKRDLVLKARIGRNELLLFPSTLLRVDCRKLNGSYFLWGVFRRSNCSSAVQFLSGHN